MGMDTVTDRDLVFVLLEAGARIERRLDSALSNIKGITFREYQLLLAMQNAHGHSATRVDLAQAVGVTPSGVTRALKPLEKLGFVETLKDTRDARRSLATLTAQGLDLVNDGTGVINDVLADMRELRDLHDADRSILNTFLQRFSLR